MGAQFLESKQLGRPRAEELNVTILGAISSNPSAPCRGLVLATGGNNLWPITSVICEYTCGLGIVMGISRRAKWEALVWQTS